MSLLWFIIKVILFILLGIILLLLIAITTVLLAPVRYEAYFAKYEEMSYDIKFIYLAGIKGSFYLQNHIKKHRVSVFGKVLYAEEGLEMTEDEKAEENVDKTDVDLSKDKAVTKQKINRSIEYKKEEKQPDITFKSKVDKKEKKVETVCREVQDSHIKEKAEETKRKAAKSVKKVKKNNWMNSYTYEASKQIIKAVWDLLKMIAPYEWDFEIVVGTGEPADTGELMAKLIMLYPWYYQHGIIKGDYEKQCLMGGFLMKGKFNLLQIVMRLVKLYFQKDVNAFIHYIKK